MEFYHSLNLVGICHRALHVLLVILLMFRKLVTRPNAFVASLESHAMIADECATNRPLRMMQEFVRETLC